MVEFNVIILKFAKKGEKTGWSYIEIPADIAQQLKPGEKKSFRVKGKLDSHSIKAIALLPMGEGNFILPINAAIRKSIGKREGAMLRVKLEVDKASLILNPELMACLTDDPEALTYFKQLPKSHQHYFSKWIESAKTEATKTKRIAQTINAMVKKQTYGEMIRSLSGNKNVSF